MRLDDRAMRRVAMLSLVMVGAVLAAPAQAISVFVRAAPYMETMPDGTTVTMWGYRVGQTMNNALNNPVISPGAAIAMPDGDTTLTVTLINQLPVPTSFVLHGHNTTMAPVFSDASGTVCMPPSPGTTAPDMAALQAFRDCRVRSFTHEAAPGGSATYTYTNVKPGTYLYQSGTLPQIQVQMGLYGLLRKNAAPTASAAQVAYPGAPGAEDQYAYDNQIALLLSEIDPIVHSGVAAGAFSGSTLAYDPKYFRLHRYNAPGTAPTACSNASLAEVAACIRPPVEFTERSIAPVRGPLTIQPGQRQLIRVVNAGIQSRALELIDGHWFLIAEDGNKIPYPREQYLAFLPAAKTADLWFTPTLGTVPVAAAIERQLTIFDRRLALTNNNADPSGGQLIRLVVANTGDVPVVDVSKCATTGTQGVAYDDCAVTTNPVLASAAYAFDVAPAGMTIDAVSGAVTWTPDNAQAWKPLVGQTASNPVQVRVTDTATGRYGTASFAVAVVNVNDPPRAADDVYDVRGGSLLNATSVLANDSDPDGDPLSAVALVAAPATGTLTLRVDGTFDYTAGSLPVSGTETRTFTYTVSDGSAVSNVATVALRIHANAAPTAMDDVAMRARYTPLSTPTMIDVLANDYDADGNIAVSTLAIVGQPNRGGTATVVTTGCPNPTRPCIRYVPPRINFRGTEAMTYTVSDALGAASPSATARVNVD